MKRLAYFVLCLVLGAIFNAIDFLWDAPYRFKEWIKDEWRIAREWADEAVAQEEGK